jgi:predicted peroxiredoxin
MRRSLLVASLVAGVMALGLGNWGRESTAQEASSKKVVVHLSHFTDSLHYPFMALKVADAMQQRGAQVTPFLDIEGSRLADKVENLRVRWGAHDTTLGDLYNRFVKAGGRVLVCPHCAEHFGIDEGALREGAKLGTNDTITLVMMAANKVVDY